jgi:hypothetical protein
MILKWTTTSTIKATRFIDPYKMKQYAPRRSLEYIDMFRFHLNCSIFRLQFGCSYHRKLYNDCCYVVKIFCMASFWASCLTITPRGFQWYAAALHSSDHLKTMVPVYKKIFLFLVQFTDSQWHRRTLTQTWLRTKAWTSTCNRNITDNFSWTSADTWALA